MDIHKQKQTAIRSLDAITKDYHVDMMVRTIKLDVYNDGRTDDVRDGFKLYYSPNGKELLYGRYWVENLEPGQRIYKETTLAPRELDAVKAWYK